MNDHSALIQEFIARKEQVLNLEMRLFILVILFQIAFVLFYLYSTERLTKVKHGPFLALSIFVILFSEILAINGKMGLISMYLRQLETYMASKGLIGAVWESRALDAIIFRPGNAFTFSAGIAVLVLFVQVLYAFYFAVSSYMSSCVKAKVITVIIGVLLIFLMTKSLTVDFGYKLPNIFSFTQESTEKIR